MRLHGPSGAVDARCREGDWGGRRGKMDETAELNGKVASGGVTLVLTSTTTDGSGESRLTTSKLSYYYRMHTI